MYQYNYEDLYESIRLGKTSNLKYLIEEFGFDYRKDNFKAFLLCIHNNRKDMARFFKEKYSASYELKRDFQSAVQVALQSCVGNDNVEMALFLLNEFDATVNYSHINQAAYNDNIEMIYSFFSNKKTFMVWDCERSYIFAINNKSFRMIKALTENYIPFFKLINEIIEACVQTDQIDILKYLVEKNPKTFEQANLSKVFR